MSVVCRCLGDLTKGCTAGGGARARRRQPIKPRSVQSEITYHKAHPIETVLVQLFAQVWRSFLYLPLARIL